MLELFANPANVVIGGALISSPIIIHLINRMRFKRIRWAAMEFLLKSQKRNRRRLIIEQLILLLLRILMVVLAALLLARFLGASPFGGAGPSKTVHLVLLDDRLSMNDQWKTKEGEKKNAFQVAKQLIEKKIAKEILESRGNHHLTVMCLSDLCQHADQQEWDRLQKKKTADDNPPTIFDKRFNENTAKELSAALQQREECTKLHLPMTTGVKAIKKYLDEYKTDKRAVYVVSDFRQSQWTGAEAVEVKSELAGLIDDNCKVTFVDAVEPQRGDVKSASAVEPEGTSAKKDGEASGDKSLSYHDNLAVVELRPETRVTAQYVLVQFKVAVANYGNAERKNVRVTIKRNGMERAEASLTLPSVPVGKPTEAVFWLSFDQMGFNQITANLEDDDFGLQADNVRYAVMEVRKQVPILVIDGEFSRETRSKPGSDSYHLETFLNVDGYKFTPGSVRTLENDNLEEYASIYLLNVAKLDSDKQLENLKKYVENGGGGVAFFLGDRVSPAYYNEALYAKGTGVFPAPLADQPTPEPSAEEKDAKMDLIRRHPSFQAFLRKGKENHPVVASLYHYPDTGKGKGPPMNNPVFTQLFIDRYHPVPRPKWKRGDDVEELMTLPNHQPLVDYEGTAIDLLKKFPIDNPKYAKYRPGLIYHSTAIRETFVKGPTLHVLAQALANLLEDQGKKDDPKRPNMKEFWEQSDREIVNLRDEVAKLQETVQLGSPLVVAKRLGKGRTVTVFTTLGQKWNHWAGGCPASYTFPFFMRDLQRYLTSLHSEAEPTVGTSMTFEAESVRYQPEMDCYYQAEAQGVTPVQSSGNKKLSEEASVKEEEHQTGEEANKRFVFHFLKMRKPGVYFFEQAQRPAEQAQRPGEAGEKGRFERKALAFNVDAVKESDLRRAATADLEKISNDKSAKVLTAAGSAPIVEKEEKGDWSESAWIYLVFLIVLVIEQALAVHLSFHIKGSELPAPAVQPQAAAA